jgi:Domain of unknown function (DUF4136)
MRALLIPALAAALMLSGCVVPTGPVEVSRFNRAAEGQSYGSGSFTVVAKGWGASQSGGSPIQTPYTAAVAREMQRVGYTDLADQNKSDLIVEVSTQVNNASMSDARSPVSVGVGGSTGGYGSGVGVGVGLDITNLINKPKPRIMTELSVRIVKRSDNIVIWEGRASQQASAGTPAAQPGIAASKLAEALFKDFPGNSGESITVP